MKKRIEQSWAVRTSLLQALYLARRKEKKDLKKTLWRRDLEGVAGTDVGFDLDYLTERGLVYRDGEKYRITALGIDSVEQETDA